MKKPITPLCIHYYIYRLQTEGRRRKNLRIWLGAEDKPARRYEVGWIKSYLKSC